MVKGVQGIILELHYISSLVGQPQPSTLCFIGQLKAGADIKGEGLR